MSKGDWLRHPAIGVALFALIGLGSIPLSKEYQIVRKAEYQAAQGYLTDSKNRTGRAQPPQRNPNPAREEWRQEKDLEAQQYMAIWAALMFGVTFAGVWYVARTLDATRNATDAAWAAVKVTEDIGKKQVRAYLGGVRAWVAEHGQRGYYCYFEIQNFGQSPAEGIEVEMRAQYNITAQGADSCTEKIPYNTGLPNHPRTLAPSAKGRCAIYINRSFVDKITAQKPREIRFYFMADVWWLDVYGDEQHTHITASQALGSWGNNQPIGEMEIHGSEPSGSWRPRHV